MLALRFGGFVDETPLFVPDNDPQLQGALVAIENRTGYVRALVGGASGEHFQFNRATQGMRQPGSSFKPIIYSVALEEKSYSPATIIVDEQIEVELEREDEIWEPRNAGGNFLGPLSLRRALELSRNICTIKILMDVGFDPVIDNGPENGNHIAPGSKHLPQFRDFGSKPLSVDIGLHSLSKQRDPCRTCSRQTNRRSVRKCPGR